MTNKGKKNVIVFLFNIYGVNMKRKSSNLYTFILIFAFSFHLDNGQPVQTTNFNGITTTKPYGMTQTHTEKYAEQIPVCFSTQKINNIKIKLPTVYIFKKEEQINKSDIYIYHFFFLFNSIWNAPFGTSMLKRNVQKKKMLIEEKTKKK